MYAYIQKIMFQGIDCLRCYKIKVKRRIKQINRQGQESTKSCADNGCQNIEKCREKAFNLDLGVTNKRFSKEVMPKLNSKNLRER